eukprot:9584642-Ditylum_brightwellii.AAC.1
MGTSPSSDIFQRRMTNRVVDVKPRPPKVYINEVLAAAQHLFDEHLKMPDEIFTRFEEAGLQANISKSA